MTLERGLEGPRLLFAHGVRVVRRRAGVFRARRGGLSPVAGMCRADRSRWFWQPRGPARRRSCAACKVGGLVASGAPPFCRCGYGTGPVRPVGRPGCHALCLWRPVRAADGCRRLLNTALAPGRPENGVTGPGRGSGARVVGVIWASGPKQGVGAAGESALEDLRDPQAGWGRGGRLGGPRGPGLPVR